MMPKLSKQERALILKEARRKLELAKSGERGEQEDVEEEKPAEWWPHERKDLQ